MKQIDRCCCCYYWLAWFSELVEKKDLDFVWTSSTSKSNDSQFSIRLGSGQRTEDPAEWLARGQLIVVCFVFLFQQSDTNVYILWIQIKSPHQDQQLRKKEIRGKENGFDLISSALFCLRPKKDEDLSWNRRRSSYIRTWLLPIWLAGWWSLITRYSCQCVNNQSVAGWKGEKMCRVNWWRNCFNIKWRNAEFTHHRSSVKFQAYSKLIDILLFSTLFLP